MLLPLDGPGVYGAITVGTTAVEAKVGANKLDQRAMVTIQPLSEAVYFGYDSSVTISTGTKIFKGQIYPIEAGDKLSVFLISENAGNNIRITEVG